MNNGEPKQGQTAQAASAQLSETELIAELRHENERLQGEAERLKVELRREHETHLRTLADFDNYRRRVERERAQMAQAGKRELILPLLEVLDDFDRALEHADDDSQPLAVGLRAIHRRLIELLAAQGVRAFESLGEYFNPLLHEAIGTVENDVAETGKIVDAVSRGWRWGNELLRPARVRVAR